MSENFSSISDIPNPRRHNGPGRLAVMTLVLPLLLFLLAVLIQVTVQDVRSGISLSQDIRGASFLMVATLLVLLVFRRRKFQDPGTTYSVPVSICELDKSGLATSTLQPGIMSIASDSLSFPIGAQTITIATADLIRIRLRLVGYLGVDFCLEIDSTNGRYLYYDGTAADMQASIAALHRDRFRSYFAGTKIPGSVIPAFITATDAESHAKDVAAPLLSLLRFRFGSKVTRLQSPLEIVSIYFILGVAAFALLTWVIPSAIMGPAFSTDNSSSPIFDAYLIALIIGSFVALAVINFKIARLSKSMSQITII